MWTIQVHQNFLYSESFYIFVYIRTKNGSNKLLLAGRENRRFTLEL